MSIISPKLTPSGSIDTGGVHICGVVVVDISFYCCILEDVVVLLTVDVSAVLGTRIPFNSATVYAMIAFPQ